MQPLAATHMKYLLETRLDKLKTFSCKQIYFWVLKWIVLLFVKFENKQVISKYSKNYFEIKKPFLFLLYLENIKVIQTYLESKSWK